MLNSRDEEILNTAGVKADEMHVTRKEWTRGRGIRDYLRLELVFKDFPLIQTNVPKTRESLPPDQHS